MRLQFVAPAILLILALPALADDAEDQALQTITQLGGRYQRDDRDPARPVILVSIGNTKVTDAGLKCLAALGELESLTLSCTKITDAGLKELAPLRKLRKLYLGSVPITDAGLKELAQLRNLGELYIGRTKITDAGLKHLAALRNLRILNVRGTRVTPAGVKALRKALPGCDVQADFPTPSPSPTITAHPERIPLQGAGTQEQRG